VGASQTIGRQPDRRGTADQAIRSLRYTSSELDSDKRTRSHLYDCWVYRPDGRNDVLHRQNKLSVCHSVIYSVTQQKVSPQDFVTTTSNNDLFSTFFHRYTLQSIRIKRSLKVRSYPKRVATLPCEIQWALESVSYNVTLSILKLTIFHDAFRM